MPPKSPGSLTNAQAIAVLSGIVVLAAIGKYYLDSRALPENEALARLERDLWLPIAAAITLLWWAVIGVAVRYYGRTLTSGIRLLWERLRSRRRRES